MSVEPSGTESGNEGSPSGKVQMTQGKIFNLAIGAVSNATGLLVAVPTGFMLGTSTGQAYGPEFGLAVGSASLLGSWIVTTLCVAVLLGRLAN